MITETSALDIVSQYTAALAAGDSARMGSMRGSDFTLDYIHRDATQSEPLTSDETTQFWLAWFGGCAWTGPR